VRIKYHPRADIEACPLIAGRFGKAI